MDIEAAEEMAAEEDIEAALEEAAEEDEEAAPPAEKEAEVAAKGPAMRHKKRLKTSSGKQQPIDSLFGKKQKVAEVPNAEADVGEVVGVPKAEADVGVVVKLDGVEENEFHLGKAGTLSERKEWNQSLPAKIPLVGIVNWSN